MSSLLVDFLLQLLFLSRLYKSPHFSLQLCLLLLLNNLLPIFTKFLFNSIPVKFIFGYLYIGACSNNPMFVYILWKNRKGEALKAMFENEKALKLADAMREVGITVELSSAIQLPELK